MSNILSIKTKDGEIQIKISMGAGGLATVKSRQIENDGYENRYLDFIFFPDSYKVSLWPIINTYFGNKKWFTVKKGEKINQFFLSETGSMI